MFFDPGFGGGISDMTSDAGTSDITDISFDLVDDSDDVSWSDAADLISSEEIDAIFSDNESDDSSEVAFDSDFNVCDGQLSLFDDEVDFIDEVITETADSEFRSEDDLVDEDDIEEIDGSSDLIEGQVDIDRFLEYQEDLHHTPAYDSSLGEWTGHRGDSIFVPSDPESQRILSALGLEGIPYKEAQPDFSDVIPARVFFTEEEMELSDARHKAMASYTLADDLPDDASDESDDEADDEFIDETNWDVVHAVYGEDIDEYYGALLSGEIPSEFTGDHGYQNEEGLYPYNLVPTAIHNACRHRGGRSHSGTKR